MIPPAFAVPLYLYQGADLPEPRHLCDYVLAAQGLIRRMSNHHTAADLLLHPFPPDLPLPGLGLQPCPLRGIHFRLPRIPAGLLLALLEDARQDMEREFMYRVRFDPAGGVYEIDRPAQRGDRLHVRYDAGNGSDVILEIHSHNRMPAFFSPTDDRDEQGGRWYAVMGHIDREHPRLALRLGMYGQWAVNMPLTTLFEGVGPFEPVWLDPAPPPPPEDDGWLSRFLPWRQ